MKSIGKERATKNLKPDTFYVGYSRSKREIFECEKKGYFLFKKLEDGIDLFFMYSVVYIEGLDVEVEVQTLGDLPDFIPQYTWELTEDEFNKHIMMEII